MKENIIRLYIRKLTSVTYRTTNEEEERQRRKKGRV